MGVKFARNVLKVNWWSQIFNLHLTFKMAAMASFRAEKCCHLVSRHKASGGIYAVVYASSWSIVHSYMLLSIKHLFCCVGHLFIEWCGSMALFLPALLCQLVSLSAELLRELQMNFLQFFCRKQLAFRRSLYIVWYEKWILQCKKWILW